jgi:flagellar basal-body rod protein FlgF
MDHLIYTAASGAKQTLEQQAVINNNLANATTSGFRAQLASMQSMPLSADGEPSTRVGVTATISGSDFSSGPISTTGRDLDVAVEGDAWLAVQATDGSEAYTRRGDLQVDANGLLMSGGHPVIGEGGPIVLPLGAALSVGGDGTISAIGEGEDPDALVAAARLKLVTPGEAGLIRGDDGLFRAMPREDGTSPSLAQDEEARVVSGALEGSNVNPLESMVAMIANAKRYEMQLKVIESANENAQRANSLLSLQG